jgi:hypothetical protein
MDSYGFLWIPMDSCGFLRIPMDSYRFLRIPMDSAGCVLQLASLIDPAYLFPRTITVSFCLLLWRGLSFCFQRSERVIAFVSVACTTARGYRSGYSCLAQGLVGQLSQHGHRWCLSRNMSSWGILYIASTQNFCRLKTMLKLQVGSSKRSVTLYTWS